MTIYERARKIAKKMHLTRYFGEPCVKCETSERYVNTDGCVYCAKERGKKYRQKDKPCEWAGNWQVL